MFFGLVTLKTPEFTGRFQVFSFLPSIYANSLACLRTNGEREREEKCWMETPLKLLSERGDENGLLEYLNELKDPLIPLFK